MKELDKKEKLRKITIKCKNCYKVLVEMGVRIYGLSSLLDNYTHVLQIICPYCGLVNYCKDVFKEDPNV